MFNLLEEIKIKMVKIHNNKLIITNGTRVPLKFLKEWFDSGRIADGFKWPSEISPGAKETVLCYESECQPSYYFKILYFI